MRDQEDTIILEIENGVANVTLNKPHVHNAFDEEMIARLAQIWDELAENNNVKAVVLRGNGKSFSAGADLGWMRRASEYDETQNKEDALNLANMLQKLYNLPQVTIASVHGAVMGGGMGLAACCDIVIADRATIFALSEVKLGLIPATIAPYVMRAIGARQARRFFQTGERFEGQKAYDIGLVHELADRPESTDYLLHKILGEIKKNGPAAMKAAKELCADYDGRALDDNLLHDSAQRIAHIRNTDEAKEGIAAFLEKRNPAWTEGNS